MSLQTDDMDIRDVQLFMEYGGNGDYYINLMERQKKVLGDNGTIVKADVMINTRISMSGGLAPTEVRLAVANLYKALEKHNLNKRP